MDTGSKDNREPAGQAELIAVDAPTAPGKKAAKGKAPRKPKPAMSAPVVLSHPYAEPEPGWDHGKAIQTIVGRWVDASRARNIEPDGRKRGQAAKEIRALIEAGNNPRLVSDAAIRAGQKLRATVIEEVHRMAAEFSGAGPVTPGRRPVMAGGYDLSGLSTGDQRLVQAELSKDNPNMDLINEILRSKSA
ncbi:hypothetical protein LX83_004991 [Goodfellowiella coeruleoviolacea]|uniref:Uncharacterized protein n=1 Tax=Goodfellowiella coeruleoviolacea TaxID=334858 RepID=A0AAE3GIN3_9PSEU|nr:hypothetical protein [Goodfellowiella coeruleoviolacea]